jgi:hypothetical protein
MVDKSEKFRWLVRVGYAARGLVYILIGYLFLAGNRNGRSGDGGAQAAFDWLQDTPGGPIILTIAAVGLLAHALYRFACAIFDVENYGRDAKGIGHRVGDGASGIAHGVLAYTAFQFANGTRQTDGGGDAAREAAATVLSMGLGSVVLGIMGIGFLVAAAMQARSACTGAFMRRISGQAPRFVEPLGRCGFAARAVVFALIGWSLVKSGWLSRGSQAKSLGEAIDSLRDTGILFTLVALGILLFGVFSLFLARYRIIPDLDAQELKPRLR